MRHAVPFITLSLAAVCAQADIYKCLNEYGHATYSNVQAKGCTRIVASPAGSEHADSDRRRPASRSTVPSGVNSATPADFPRVDVGTQRRRDDGRRRILDTEMANEQVALDTARRHLLEKEAQSPPPGDLSSARDRVALHERNVEALRKELSRLK